METIESLLTNPHNHGYTNDHGVIGCDIQKVNRTISLIENSRDEKIPIPGDIIICKGPKNRMYPKGHLELPYTEDIGGAICTQPMIPFVRVDDFDCLHFGTSGGYWLSCTELDMYVYKGKQTKVFCEWGNGYTANGAVYFNAFVNVWELFLETIY